MKKVDKIGIEKDAIKIYADSKTIDKNCLDMISEFIDREELDIVKPTVFGLYNGGIAFEWANAQGSVCIGFHPDGKYVLSSLTDKQIVYSTFSINDLIDEATNYLIPYFTAKPVKQVKNDENSSDNQ